MSADSPLPHAGRNGAPAGGLLRAAAALVPPGSREVWATRLAWVRRLGALGSRQSGAWWQWGGRLVDMRPFHATARDSQPTFCAASLAECGCRPTRLWAPDATRLEAARGVLVGLAQHPKETGAGVSVTRFWKTGSVDYKKVVELRGVDLEQYRGEVESGGAGASLLSPLPSVAAVETVRQRHGVLAALIPRYEGIGNEQVAIRKRQPNGNHIASQSPTKPNGLAIVRANPLIHMVGAAGFELATPCTPCKCATRLRYAPTKRQSIRWLLSVIPSVMRKAVR